MSQENEIEAKKTSPTTDFLPSDGASCSASSDTPETDAEHNRPVRIWEECYYGMRAHAEKMERQRNAAWQTLKEIRELFTADESFGATVEALFAKPLEESEAEIARLNSLLNK